MEEPAKATVEEQPGWQVVFWEQSESKNRRRGTRKHTDSSFVKFCLKGEQGKGVVTEEMGS